jgi:ABC-type transport system involved in multi-copper enzyme maturation permease subunit
VGGIENGVTIDLSIFLPRFVPFPSFIVWFLFCLYSQLCLLVGRLLFMALSKRQDTQMILSKVVLDLFCLICSQMLYQSDL